MAKRLITSITVALLIIITIHANSVIHDGSVIELSTINLNNAPEGGYTFTIANGGKYVIEPIFSTLNGLEVSIQKSDGTPIYGPFYSAPNEQVTVIVRKKENFTEDKEINFALKELSI